MSGDEKNKSARHTADKKFFILMAIVLVCFSFSPPQAGAATNWLEKAKLLASDGAASDWFGYSVSISGDYAIVGTEQISRSVTGKAYIFKWDGTNWVQQQKLLASDGAAGDQFGYSVSISGDYAIGGARGSDGNVIGSGAAYIFKRDGTTWSEQAKLTALDGADSDEFGYSVSISGDFAIVGAYGDDDNGDYSGSAYIFKRDGTNWVQQVKLTASDGAAEDCFGYSVSISTDYAIVGAMDDDDKGDYSGSAYIFRWDGTSWIEQQKLNASDGAAADNFGYSVSISGDLAIAGAVQYGYGSSCIGKAYIFRWDGTSWSQQTKLLASDGAAGDVFGCSVAISGDFAIVGAFGDDDKGSDSGSAYIFNKFCPKADLNGDCKVDFTDLAIFADSWLYGTD